MNIPNFPRTRQLKISLFGDAMKERSINQQRRSATTKEDTGDLLRLAVKCYNVASRIYVGGYSTSIQIFPSLD
jgi:hypothetical protein